MQTLASQLSSTLMQLLFSFDGDMRVEKTLMQTLASQLSSSFEQLINSGAYLNESVFSLQVLMAIAPAELQTVIALNLSGQLS
jgi:hypothetical protein